MENYLVSELQSSITRHERNVERFFFAERIFCKDFINYGTQQINKFDCNFVLGTI